MAEDFVDGAAEFCEWAVFDHDDIAAFEAEVDLWAVAGRSLDHSLRFVVGERSWFRPALYAFFDGDEVGDAGGVADYVPAVVVHDHVDEEITGVHGFLDVFGLTVGHLDDGLLRHDGVEDLVFEVHGDDALFEVLTGAVFSAGVGVYHVPVGRVGDHTC